MGQVIRMVFVETRYPKRRELWLWWISIDAITSDRPHRKAMTAEKDLDILRDEASKEKLDKEVVDCLSELVH
jgi:hypothetical protein